VATYAIGDIQGCHREFVALLAAIAFNPKSDRLWLTGDLVNRGPASLAVLREAMALGERVVTVLGNHDLHLLSLAHRPGATPGHRDTLDEVLAAPDRDDLLAWLRHRPLIHRDQGLDYTLIHAGLPPVWSTDEAFVRAAEVTDVLRSAEFPAFLEAMYGDAPHEWDPALRGEERLRFITNCFTRMRYCNASGRLNLAEKGAPDERSDSLLPWFALPDRASRRTRIIFGHWSTLRLNAQQCRRYNVYPLDTGAVWGGQLTAMRLDDGRQFSVPSSQALPIT
jgi:bis(5'-nucleosyl)-tetraphosphatase (symmetrical)